MENLDLQLEREGQAAVVLIRGRLDGNTSKVFHGFLAERLKEDDLCVVLDVAGLEFISSAGLREFMTLLKRLAKHQTRPAMFGMTPSVALAMEIAGFDVLFERTKDRASAVRAVIPTSGREKKGLLSRFFKGAHSS